MPAPKTMVQMSRMGDPDSLVPDGGGVLGSADSVRGEGGGAGGGSARVGPDSIGSSAGTTTAARAPSSVKLTVDVQSLKPGALAVTEWAPGSTGTSTPHSA